MALEIRPAGSPEENVGGLTLRRIRKQARDDNFGKVPRRDPRHTQSPSDVVRMHQRFGGTHRRETLWITHSPVPCKRVGWRSSDRGAQ